MIDTLDLEGLIRLMESGFSLTDSMDLIEQKHNREAFAAIRNELEQGRALDSFFPAYLPKKCRVYAEGFLHWLPFQTALSLAFEMSSSEQKLRHEVVRQLAYPILLLAGTITGILLFSRYCFPPIITMMSGFHVPLDSFVILQKTAALTGFVGLGIMLGCVIITGLIQNPARRIRAYETLLKYIPDSLWTEYESIVFVRFFSQCLARKISTRQAMELLQNMAHRPITAHIAAVLNTSLNRGDPFVQAASTPLLESALLRFIRIAASGAGMEAMLSGYLETAGDRLNRRCRRLTRAMQLVAYALVGLIVIMMYQILLLPLSIMTNL